MMSNAHGRKLYAHMNNGQSHQYIGRPGVVPNLVYGKLVGTTDEQHLTRYLQGES